jgi:hypothetical protein
MRRVSVRGLMRGRLMGRGSVNGVRRHAFAALHESRR